MSKPDSVPNTPLTPWWAARTTLNVLRSFQILLSVTTLTLASCTIHMNYGVDRILRLSLAVSIISVIYFLIIRVLPVLWILVMEIILSILWFSAFVTLASDFGSVSCKNMPRGINFDYSCSCKVAKAALVPEAIMFILFLATTYVSYLAVVSQARQCGSNTRSILKAACKTSVKMLRRTILYLESCFEEDESLLDLEGDQAEKVEIADDEEST
ncbi:hypothetical protein SEUBUCD646_0G00160 [Saccharomyces eubayanus]|uniref:MARVEL domain-containing protein n=1 Tax=Saccharomyces eubayanus TaxID=1080349 RepID=A0ABN8VUM2_SACEU|nr:hypothetical protein SEUBUCD650_0G00170 [Saccharomyces eubayanus]CAI2005587.1 hypothetical protein SEUBUCD646_0G00160 [Saccharomyces eubayanus]